MTYNVKGKPMRMFKPTAKLTFATNHLPRVTDRSDGIWRRIQILPFTTAIPPGERNLKLKTYEYWDPELAGIFNWALIGLKRLMRSGQFTRCESSEIEKQDYKESAQPELQFLEECVVIEEDECCVQKEFHAAYKEWCFDHGFKAMNSKTLSKMCIAHHPLIKLDFNSLDNSGKRVRTFRGLRLRHGYDS